MAKHPLFKVLQGSELVLDRRRWRVVGKDHIETRQPDWLIIVTQGIGIDDINGSDGHRVGFNWFQDCVNQQPEMEP
ncbi:hypothetical protein [Halocynthiibacter styelae]|uniref:Uncharacterized protein n=1 Tax=Halocynthiibacter styelae TaxID=2761955 RepID=A0A8J7LQ26_9RHOB|nr:hypothetical protein [Paenihalocynthiibacter styelae]MBI1494501.1 hypothetical protein [Paenihalocynthiibacter styelae]